MRNLMIRGKSMAGLVALCLLASSADALAAPSSARSIRISAASVGTPLGDLPDVVVTLGESGAGAELDVDARAALFALPDWGYRFEKPRLRCRLGSREDATQWRCDGRLSTSGSGDSMIEIRWLPDGLGVKLRQAGAGIVIEVPAEAGPVRIKVTSMPIQWLQAALAILWPGATFSGGKVDADLAYRDAATPGLSGQLSGSGLGLDTADGRIAAAGLGVDGELALTLGADSTGIVWRGQLEGGEWLADPLYVAMPEARVDIVFHAAIGRDEWRIDQLDWRDGDSLRIAASARYRPDATPSLARLSVDMDSADLARAAPRYLDSLLAVGGLSGLELRGALGISTELVDGLPERVDIRLHDVSSRDARQRFELAALDGELHWRHRGEAAASKLRFDAGAIYGVALGEGELTLGSDNGALRLAAPARVEALGGVMHLARLVWIPAFVTGSSAQFELGLGMEGLDLDQLSRLLGWPAFGGTLSGNMPSARYADGVMRFDGGLDMNVFGGRIRIDDLSMERPFGVAPTLAADLSLNDLELVPLTRSFGFGEISGRLQGHVNGLRLVDWSPVAFDADLHTSTTSGDKRRISQRAVNDLSSVGGSGIAGGIQSRLLKVFDTFGYARIGLKCRLENNVCHMDGLDSSPGGYTIVEGSGLPRVSVIGHQREVDWPVLLARLRAAADGQTPRIQ